MKTTNLYELPFSFGSFVKFFQINSTKKFMVPALSCEVVENNEKWVNNTQPGVFRLLISCVFINDFNKLNDFFKDISDSYATPTERKIREICRMEKNLDKEICNMVESIPVDDLCRYTREYIYPAISKNKEKFLYDLTKWIHYIPNHKKRKELLDIANFKFSYNNTGASETLLINLIAQSLKYVLTANNEKPEDWNNYIRSKNAKQDTYHPDPHNLGDSRTLSYSILEADENDHFEKHLELLYNLDKCLDYIQRDNYLIKKITFRNEPIRIHVEKSKYHFRKITDDDISQVKTFITSFEREFRRKESWRERTLASMAENGLKKGYWIGWGFFDNNKLIAYIDEKLRINGDVEVGILLVDNSYRKQGLAKSLLYWIQLKNIAHKIYGGTFEENVEMRKTFESTGFRANNIHVNEKTNIISNKKLERYHPTNPNILTNSVYYICDSLIERNMEVLKSHDYI